MGHTSNGSPRVWLMAAVTLVGGSVVSGIHPPALAGGGRTVTIVEAQPLLAQIHRVEQAMDAAGSPLPTEVQARLRDAEKAGSDAAVSSAVQSALDPLCLAEVRIRPDGTTEATRGPVRPALYEQGWRLFLVKVVNEAGATTTLRATSPNALPVPNAPAEAVSHRWLDLRMVDDRPLNPTLSGLGLEYRLLQVYARDPGDLPTRLFFNVGQLNLPALPEGLPSGGLIRTWTFERDTQGWRAQNQCDLEARDGVLRITSTGNDPFMAAPVETPGGRMMLRFRARLERDTVGQVYWWTQDRPSPDGERMKFFSMEGEPGKWRSYAVSFAVQGRMLGLRLDPGNAPGLVELDDLTLAYEDEPAPLSAALPVSFTSEPSQPVRFDVRDEHGKPTTAAFVVRDRQSRVYPAQPKRLAPDFFFQSQIYRAHGETLRLPPGEYTVACSRGPESIPETRTLAVRAGTPAEIRYQVRRWVDPARLGWYSGDHHIHAAGCAHYTSPTEGVHPPDMLRHIIGEDLKVGANLTWGPCFDYQKQFFKGKVDPISKHPYLLRYDIEVSGFGSHQSGHLCLLRLKQQIYPGGNSKDHWPTLGLNTLRWAKKQGAVCGPAHSSLGLTPTRDRVAGVDGPNGLPNYAIPAYNGIGANEFIVDVTHRVPGPDWKLVPAVDFISTMNTNRTAELNIWYHVLNCGFRTRISGETDFPCVSAERVGLGRVYVKQSGKLSYDDWCEGIRQGRSYVSDGYHHLMDLEAYPLGGGRRRALLGEQGSELKVSQPGQVRFRAKVSARRPENGPVVVELVVNGYPVAKTTLAGDGQTRDVALDAPITRSSWAALRIFPNAHTNPVFVTVGGKPFQPQPRSVDWCLRGVDQCWREKERFYAPAEKLQAQQAYEHARQVYRGMLREAATP